MVETPRSKSPFLAVILSIPLPGLGQFYVGERPKAVGLFSITAGIVISLVAFRSNATMIMMGLLYIAVMIPAAGDAYQTATGRPSSFRSDAVWYVVLMLLAVGPFALPLLWQSKRFSHPSKIVWTVLVIAVAVLCIVIVAMLGPLLDQLLGSQSTALS